MTRILLLLSSLFVFEAGAIGLQHALFRSQARPAREGLGDRGQYQFRAEVHGHGHAGLVQGQDT